MKGFAAGLLRAAVFSSLLVNGGIASAARVVIRVAPPEPRHEVVLPRPGPNHVWVPGYWNWNGTAYAWVPGVWQLPPRRHSRWIPGHYRHFRRGGWEWIPGHWR